MSDDGHRVTFGTLYPDGRLEDVRRIRQADIVACLFAILEPSHYRPDGPVNATTSSSASG